MMYLRQVFKIFQINYLVSVLLIFSAIILANLSIYSLKRREVAGSLAFSLLMMGFCIYSVGYAFEIISTDLETMKFWVSFEYIGISYIPFLIFLFINQYSENNKISNRILLFILFFISTTTFVLVQTNDFHNLFYSSLSVDYTGVFPTLKIEKGIWYWVDAVILSLVVIYGNITYLVYYYKSESIYRAKVFFLIAGSLVPYISNLLYLMNFGPANIDLSPFAFIIMGFLYMMGLFKYDMLELFPVTYKQVFENIEEGVVVLDDNDQIINYNKAAVNIFEDLEEVKKGRLITVQFKDYPIILNDDEQEGIIEIKRKMKINKYRLKKTKVYNKKIQFAGKILVFNDITKEQKALKVLEKYATVDELTGLYNRRYFLEYCEEYIKNAKRYSNNASFILMDIDYFKRINDTYGHQAGDSVLKEIAYLCCESIRNNDIIGRYGGEEFAILLPDTKIQDAFKLTERLRKNIKQKKIKATDDSIVLLTASFGLYELNTETDEKLSEVFMKADRALYQAKEKGRDKIVVYKP